jgi:hypothetical protein
MDTILNKIVAVVLVVYNSVFGGTFLGGPGETPLPTQYVLNHKVARSVPTYIDARVVDFIPFNEELYNEPLLGGTTTTYTTVETGTYTVPAGVYSITVEGWGAGGGGGVVNNSGGGGGGGGAYAATTIAVVPGMKFQYTVPAGGTADSATTAGSATFVKIDNGTTYISAEGGTGTATATAATSSGGDAADSIGTVKYDGGNSANGNGTSDGGGGGGGSGGPSGAGGNGAAASTTVGGGGGGGNGGTSASGATAGTGCSGNCDGGAGGNGADGGNGESYADAGGGGGGGDNANNGGLGGAPGGGGGGGEVTGGQTGGRGQIRVTENERPSVVLNTADAMAFGTDTTPTLEFTGTDTEAESLTYNVQIYSQAATSLSTITLSTDTHDGYETNGTTWSGSGDGSNYCYIGYGAAGDDLDGGIIIPSIAVSSEAVIKNATLYLYGFGDSSSSPTEFNIRAFREDSAAAFSTDGSNRPSLRTYGRLSKAVSYDFPFAFGTWAFDVTELVQEIVNRSGWASGNNIGFILENVGTTLSVSFAFEDTANAGANEPYFTLSYRDTIRNVFSDTDSGFANTVTPADTTPFNSGEKASYEVQTALTDGTYFWRAVASDSGTTAYSAWPASRSFTISGGATPTPEASPKDSIIWW